MHTCLRWRRTSSPEKGRATMSRPEKDVRLLMVDDEGEFLQAMEPGLCRRGFDVTTAQDGVWALKLLAERTFDVVLLDVKMPVLDGVDTFREINRLAPNLPVVLLTGHGNITQAFETSREGVFEYLTKPCAMEDLVRVLREAVSRSPDRGERPVTREEVRLLLVDDDIEFARALIPSLEHRGVQVSAAHGAEEAMERAADETFHVAVLDVVMEGLSGLTLMKRLREADPLLEVIILTGNPSIADVRTALREGAFEYLTKPHSMEELLQAIRGAVEHRHRREEEEREGTVDQIFTRSPE